MRLCHLKGHAGVKGPYKVTVTYKKSVLHAVYVHTKRDTVDTLNGQEMYMYKETHACNLT